MTKGPGKRRGPSSRCVASEGFEPPKAEPSDLQSDPFGRLGNLPRSSDHVYSPDRRRSEENTVRRGLVRTTLLPSTGHATLATGCTDARHPTRTTGHAASVPSVTHAITHLGGVARLGELRSLGLSDDAVQRAVGTEVIRVRHGIYATPDAPPLLVRAARVGGALAAASAAPLHHLWQPPSRHTLDVSVRPEARGLLHPVTGQPLTTPGPVRLIRDRHRHDEAERWVVSPTRCLAQCVRLEPCRCACGSRQRICGSRAVRAGGDRRGSAGARGPRHPCRPPHRRPTRG